MKKGLLGGTALVGAAALMAGAAVAAEAPTYKLSGNMNFQFYYVDQDFVGVTAGGFPTTSVPAVTTSLQEHDWYFGVDESELALNVSGTADNGLNYGFKVEIQVNTTDTAVADEARLQFSGGWGTIQMGDEDGAEDIMNYGGETLIGATGGFDGDWDDVLFAFPGGGPLGPTLIGDTSDATKISYFSPRFSGFQVGASLTPQPGLSGDDFKVDGSFENSIGLGANYDNTFGDLRARVSGVYVLAASTATGIEDIAAWSVGGVVNFGPFGIGGAFADNGDSGVATGSGISSSYWDVAASFETGPIYLSAGYFFSTQEYGILGFADSEYSNISLTADYDVAPGLGVYAEVQLTDDDLFGATCSVTCDNAATIFIAGANVSF